MLIQECIVLECTSSKPGAGLGRLVGKENTIYGVSSDDATSCKKGERKIPVVAVMVRSDDLSSDAITKAMLKGDFYSSSGVMLEKLVGKSLTSNFPSIKMRQPNRNFFWKTGKQGQARNLH